MQGGAGTLPRPARSFPSRRPVAGAPFGLQNPGVSGKLEVRLISFSSKPSALHPFGKKQL